MIGTGAILVTGQLSAALAASYGSKNLAYAAGAVALSIFALALVLSFFLPEPKREELPD
jgi:hypothetical protein